MGNNLKTLALFVFTDFKNRSRSEPGAEVIKPTGRMCRKMTVKRE